jgi:hypothetical protein
MAAWLNLFLLVGVSRLTQVLGMVAAVVGALNLKDFAARGGAPRWRFRRRRGPGSTRGCAPS